MTGAIAVRMLGSGDRSRWDAFVRECADATFFHLCTWQEIIEDVFGHRTWYLYAERDGQIVGVLPLAQVKSVLFGNSLSSLPFCMYGGVAAADDAARAALEEHAEQLAKERGVEHLEYRNFTQRHADWPTQDLYVTFRKSILPDDEANLQAIPRKQRAMVRKGIKNGLRSEMDDGVERFFDLYAGNMLRHGTPAFPKRLFAELTRRFGDACDVLVVTDQGGKPLSGVLSFYFRNEVLPYYAGDAVEARQLAANDFKYWELLRRARERGCEIFDYGRSKLGTGSFSFKKNWGFEPSALSYEYRLYKRDRVPQNNPLNPKYRALIAMWRRLPLVVANTIGPHIVRNLG